MVATVVPIPVLMDILTFTLIQAAAILVEVKEAATDPRRHPAASVFKRSQ